MPPYTITPPVNCNIDFSLDALVGKTALVTGGANGLGKAYVQALSDAGCNVVVGDKFTPSDEHMPSELKDVKLVQCDVTNWDDQVRLFKEAANFSPSGKIHYVIANAGIFQDDEVFSFDGNDGPKKPDMSIIDVNLKGTLYTAKLAQHYFISQNGTQVSDNQEDTCLILISSGAAVIDMPRTPQYTSTKWAVRGIMHALRRTSFHYGSRINVISPWYIRTSLLPKEAFDSVEETGLEFARAEDAAECALRILSDKSINGRSLFVCARKWAPRGYLDLDIEEHSSNDIIQEAQADQMRSSQVELGIFP